MPTDTNESTNHQPIPLLAVTAPEDDGSILVLTEEDGSVLLEGDEVNDDRTPEEEAEIEAKVYGAPDFVPCGEPHPDMVNTTCSAHVGHDGLHVSVLPGGGYATWDPEVESLPGSIQALSERQHGQGEAPTFPEPQFGPPAGVHETAEVSGARLGMDPSPLRDAYTAQQPTQVTSGGVVDTTNDSFVAPGNEPLPQTDSEGNPSLDDPAYDNLNIDRLRDFLEARFPHEMGLTNTQVPESPVDVAIRLLTQFHATSMSVPRCETSYCNKPKGHVDDVVREAYEKSRTARPPRPASQSASPGY